MSELKDTLSLFADKLAEKLNSLKTELGQIIPWKGLSPNTGQSLTTDSEGKVYYRERTPEEIATAYEGLTDRNRFSNAHKATVESLEDQFLQIGQNVISSINNELGNTTWQTQKTVEQIQDIVGAMLQSGTHTNITVDYDDVNGTINLTGTSGGTGTALSEEEVEDIVGGLATQGTGINVFYDDANNALVVSLSGESFTTAHKNKLEATEVVTAAEKTTWNGKADNFSATENQYGTHPAFSNQNEAIAWILQNIGNTSQPSNSAPTDASDSYSVDQDTTLTVNSANGVLANASDADGDNITAILVSGVSNGTLNFNADGSFTYTPNSEYIGSDSFVYRANDGTADGPNVTVTITVNDVALTKLNKPTGVSATPSENTITINWTDTNS